MLIKVCGMREADNIRAVEALDIDWMGFIFYAKSPRCIPAKPDYLPQRVKRVGVFVNESANYILEQTTAYQLD